MPYVSRDDHGNITGLYANPQPGFGEEYLPDNDPQVLAFLNPPPPINPTLNGMTPPTINEILIGGL